MNDEELGLPPDLSPDYQGIPDTADDHAPRASGQLADDAMPMPNDHPFGVSGRVTAAEELEGESLDERLRQEEPDRMVPDPPHPGRLVAPESGVDEIDSTSEDVGFMAPEIGLALSAEEEAVRIEHESLVFRGRSNGRSDL